MATVSAAAATTVVARAAIARPNGLGTTALPVYISIQLVFVAFHAFIYAHGGARCPQGCPS